MELIVLKLGGSCLTHKREGIPKIRREVLSGLLRSLARLSNATFKTLIVHGGGSITHPLLNKYRIVRQIQKGDISSTKDKVSAAKVHLAMNDLNNTIVDAFLASQIPAWPIQTSAILTSDNGRIRLRHLNVILTALVLGYIPILHGDFNLDEVTNINVCSGDLLACLLAKKLAAQKLLFATDVKGIYSNDPRTSDEIIFHKTFSSKKELSQFVNGIKEPTHFDHSGGMLAKMNYILKYCNHIQVQIFDGIMQGSFDKIFNDQHIGTIIDL